MLGQITVHRGKNGLFQIKYVREFDDMTTFVGLFNAKFNLFFKQSYAFR